jgi:hypothetical protein
VGGAFSVGSGTVANGSTTIDAAIPDDPSLVGQTICFVAVVIDARGRILAIARTGGPIIEDAIC